MSTSDDPADRPSREHSPHLQQVKDSAHRPTSGAPAETSKPASPRRGHQRLVFADPVAFRYLEEDPATIVLERRGRLHCYEIYVVEQWACSRTHPTFIIATYTGDTSHSILVGVLSVPKDENAWSSRLKVYFKAMFEYHAREKETPLGTLMVTNLSGFPSSLTVISIPDGDVRKHREDFIVNENLKRLGCAGRSGLNLQHPQPSTIAKFHHLFRTSERLPPYTSVMELVKLCQLSLFLYGKLAPAYADGLLCDVTERSINDWWSDIGTFIYNVEVNDGILGPSTVSALVGLLMGAFNRLKAFGAPVGKDVFDITSTKRAIGYFQRSQRMESTRRLDRHTLTRLHKVTAKTASGEGWNVPKAVKSTVAELSGKGGEMVMGIVGGREKAGIAEVETLDIERLAQLVTGTKAKWLWQGKCARSNEADTPGSFGPSENEKVFGTDDQGKYLWTSKHRDSVLGDNPHRRKDHADDLENRTGFGRFKDAVSLRSHQPRQPKEEVRLDVAHMHETHDRRDAHTSVSPSDSVPPDTTTREIPSSAPKGNIATPTEDLSPSPDHNTSHFSLPNGTPLSQQTSVDLEPDPAKLAKDLGSVAQIQNRRFEEMERKLSSATHSSFFRDIQDHEPRIMGLRRTRSSVKVVDIRPENPCMNRVPRCLSFSAVESVVLGWNDLGTESSSKTIVDHTPQRSIIEQAVEAVYLRKKAEQIFFLEQVTVPLTESQVSDVEELDRLSQRKQDELNEMYYERLEDYQTQRATSTDIMAYERRILNEGLGKIETLGAKLDYELQTLESRVQEVEDGVTEFERAVTRIEGRVGELVDKDEQSSPWWSCLCRFFGLRNS